ncbi:Uncharacterized protein pbN1_34230 [Aromatoleum bremense]|nr:Uncharacterized protein pbN1_34230 [Aromatoleum bremense]
MLSSTVDRVPAHTAAHINQWIREHTRENVERAGD